MNKIIFIIFILSLVGCGKSHKLTLYGKPFKRYKSKAELEFSTISFLFVLDDSGSMHSIHNKMVSNFKAFLPIVKDNPKYDYNFAVTTMTAYKNFSLPAQPPLFMADSNNFKACILDSDKDDLNNIIHKTNVGSYFNYSSNSNTSFETLSCLLYENIIQVEGYYDDSEEHYFQSLDYIMEFADQKMIENFFSRNVFLVIIFISDAIGYETEKNYRLNATDKFIVSEAGRLFGTQKINALLEFKRDNQVKAYGVIPREPNLGSTCGEGSNFDVNFPAHAFSFIKKSGGKYFSICDGDNWGRDLKVIKKDLKNSISHSYFLLDELPLVSTIKVFFNGDPLLNNIETGWYYNPETVSIHVGRKFNYKDIGLKRTISNEFVIEYQPMNLEILYKKD